MLAGIGFDSISNVAGHNTYMCVLILGSKVCMNTVL